jgi:hypothetical protein
MILSLNALSPINALLCLEQCSLIFPLFRSNFFYSPFPHYLLLNLSNSCPVPFVSLFLPASRFFVIPCIIAVSYDVKKFTYRQCRSVLLFAICYQQLNCFSGFHKRCFNANVVEQVLYFAKIKAVVVIH